VNSVLFAFIAMQPQSELYLFAIIPLPAWALGALFIFYESRMQRSSQSTGIAHDAHLYGGLWGILSAIVLHPEVGQSWLDLLS
jgi:membrane associated rhomboid family serine protease